VQESTGAVEPEEIHVKLGSGMAVLAWRDGRIATVSFEEGWKCEDPSLEDVLNLGWSTRNRVPRRKDAFASMVREVAKVFSADLIELGEPAGDVEAPDKAA